MTPLIRIPTEALAPETLTALIEAFILKEGTDYGAQEVSLETRQAQVRRQLESEQAHIVFHFESESCTVITDREFRETLPLEDLQPD